MTQAKLPGREALTRQVEQFRQAIEANDEAVPELGARLYDVLFGFAPQTARAAPCWYLSLDDAMLALPFSALRTSGREGGRWLAESHQLAVVPSAFWLLQDVRPARSRRLLAVGDAVRSLPASAASVTVGVEYGRTWCRAPIASHLSARKYAPAWLQRLEVQQKKRKKRTMTKWWQQRQLTKATATTKKRLYRAYPGDKRRGAHLEASASRKWI